MLRLESPRRFSARPVRLLQLPESPHARQRQSFACPQEPLTARRRPLIVGSDETRDCQIDPPER